jgi:uncharacterized protein
MAEKSALIVAGGWDGHEPEKVGRLFKEILEVEGYEVELSDDLRAFENLDRHEELRLIVPVWTMGEISPGGRDSVLAAVRDRGVGIAGCHGGMCDAFRQDTEWHFLTGGQWVAHPGGDQVRYWVKMNPEASSPITSGLIDFEVQTEQYYLHVDPGVQVLAYTEFPNPTAEGPHVQNPCRMPQMWTKMYGKGRVFYNALGHQHAVLDTLGQREIMRRGFLWAAGQI